MISPEFLDNDSSVEIKGMKMPDSCDCCIFNRNNGPYLGVSCIFSTHIWPDKPRTEEEPRLDFCPLRKKVRNGRWVVKGDAQPMSNDKVYGCSLCDDNNRRYYEWQLSNYCPNCGAKMDGGQDKNGN